MQKQWTQNKSKSSLIFSAAVRIYSATVCSVYLLSVVWLVKWSIVDLITCFVSGFGNVLHILDIGAHILQQ